MNKFFAGAFLGFIFGVFIIECANNAAKKSDKDLPLDTEDDQMKCVQAF